MRRSAVFVVLAVAACGPSVKTVTVEPAKVALDAKGATAKLVAVAKDDKGQPIDAAKLKVAWSSSVPQVAAVDETGAVTAQRSGESVITASIGEIKGTAQALVSIPNSISVSLPSRDLRPGETVVLSVVVVDDTGKPVTVSRTITWTSSDPAIATVVDGKVLAVGPGTATITAAAGPFKGTSAVTVKVPEFAKLALTPAKTQTLKRGDSLPIKVSALDKKGQKVAGVLVAWKSSDTRVATVSPEGVVHAVKKGGATITASASGKSATVKVTVTDTATKSKSKSKNKKK
jgi:trimeric autotransporter adhesin